MFVCLFDRDTYNGEFDEVQEQRNERSRGTSILHLAVTRDILDGRRPNSATEL
jgi:hypothetical protein